MNIQGQAALVTGGGSGTLTTLGGGAPTVGAGVGVCTPTLGVVAGVGGSWMLGGPPVGRLKMARRLSTASSWA